MITVNYYRDHNRVVVEGHAQSGEPGHDLVCAATTILAYTIGSSVENMVAAGHVKEHHMEFSDGYASISCGAPEGLKSTITLMFDTICAGFELLAHDYPDNISYKIEG